MVLAMSKSTKPEVRQLTTTEGFLCGAFAACIAVCNTFESSKEITLLILSLVQVTASNPAEVVKTRLQLQGELAKGGGKKVYNSAVDALVKTWKNEGLRGVQRGLTPAVSVVIYGTSWLITLDVVFLSGTYLGCL